MTLIVDAETGLVLQQRNDGFHSVAEWEELEFDVALSDELFIWDASLDHRQTIALSTRPTWLAAENGLNETASAG